MIERETTGKASMKIIASLLIYTLAWRVIAIVHYLISPIGMFVKNLRVRS